MRVGPAFASLYQVELEDPEFGHLFGIHGGHCMKNLIQTTLVATLLSAAGACTPKSTSVDAGLENAETTTKASEISGRWSITRLQGFTQVNNDFYKIDKSGDALDNEVLDLTIKLDSEGKGLMEGQSRCRDIQTRINFRTNLLSRPIISEVGIMKGASLVALTTAAGNCEAREEGTNFIPSKQKVIPAKLADGSPMTSFRPNKGLIGANWSSFRADKECKKLTDMRFIQLLNVDSQGKTDGCIGFTDRDKKSLRLILLPYAQSHIIQADFEAAQSLEDNLSDAQD
jgi:hypothetical protein